MAAVEGLNVKNVCKVLEALDRDVPFMRGMLGIEDDDESVVATYLEQGLQPPIDEVKCRMCLEGIILMAVDPGKAEWNDNGGCVMLFYRDDENDVRFSQIPSDWYQENFGVPVSMLMPVERIPLGKRVHEHMDWLVPSSMNDQYGAASWQWMSEHLTRLRDIRLSG